MDLHDTSTERETPLLSSKRPTMEENDENATAINESALTLIHHEGSQPLQVDQETIMADDDDVWYKNPHQITAMLSNYSTSYNVVNISLVLPILQQLNTKSSAADSAACASSLLAGMVLGQLGGGALGDSFLGRLGALNLVMSLQIIASIASACIPIDSGNIYVKLALWRFVLGVGAGGVYPLAAVLSAEQGNKSSNKSNADQGKRVVLTFSTQGLGFVTCPLVAVPLLHITTNLNLIWRILLGLGSLPGLVLMVMQWRLYVRNNPRGDAIPLEEPPETDMESPPEGITCHDSTDDIVMRGDTADVPRNVGWLEAISQEPGLGRKLIGTAGTWCLFDVLFYGNTLFQPIVVEAAFGSAESDSPIHVLQKTAIDSLILTSIALPGYAMAGLLIGKRTCCVLQTPRYVMLQGFAAMSVLYFAIGSNWAYLRHYPVLLVSLYGLTFFFANYGPNTTTFILPSLLYSPECRSTLNGISAASGKLGALMGATLFAPAAAKWGSDVVMIICSGVAILSFVITWCFLPTDEVDQQPSEQQELLAGQDEENPESEVGFESA